MEHEITALFARLGISRDDARVYSTLLEKGPLGVSDIARATDLYRPTVYAALRTLKERELVTEHAYGKRTQYEAAHPSVLRERADALARDTRDLVPQLVSRMSSSATPKVRTLTGRDGIAAAYMDIVHALPKGATFYHYTAVRNQRKIDSYVPAAYREIRDRKELERLTIASAHAKGEKRPRLERYLKTLGKDTTLFGQNVDLFIYGTRISIFSFDEERAVIIDDPAVADFQKRIFVTLFNLLPRQ